MARAVEVDEDLCIGSAECARIAPEAFAIDDARGVSIPLPAAREVPRLVIDEAVAACPMRAITVSER